MGIRRFHEHAETPDAPGGEPVGDDAAARVAGSWARDERGATSLEWALLLAAVALPSYAIIQIALATLIGHYQLMTSLNALPFP